MCCIIEQKQQRRDEKLEKPDDAEDNWQVVKGEENILKNQKLKQTWQVVKGEGELFAKAVCHHHYFTSITIDAIVVEGYVGGNGYNHTLEDHYQVKDTLANERRLVEHNSFFFLLLAPLVSSDEICEFKMCVAVLAR